MAAKENNLLSILRLLMEQFTRTNTNENMSFFFFFSLLPHCQSFGSAMAYGLSYWMTPCGEGDTVGPQLLQRASRSFAPDCMKTKTHTHMLPSRGTLFGDKDSESEQNGSHPDCRGLSP